MKFMDHAKRRLARAAGVLGVALLASCGGGEQVNPFSPTRMFVFGDESSVLNYVDPQTDPALREPGVQVGNGTFANGTKYTVNQLTAATTTAPSVLDCKAFPLWTQYIATTYGLVFPQCNPDKVENPTGRIFAVAGAKVGDLEAQIDRKVAVDGFTRDDLVTVLIGANDIQAVYATYTGSNDDAVIASVEEAGETLAGQINRMADLGGKILLSTVPDMGLTPFAIAEEAAIPGRAAFLTLLTQRFNASMRASIHNDGRHIGLVLTDERIQVMVRVPQAFGLTNVTQAACLATAELPTCTTDTLVVDDTSTTTPKAHANGATWLWADSTHISPGGHSEIGLLAAQRAADNPF